MILTAIFSCKGCAFELPGRRWQLVGSPETTFYLCPPGPGRPGVPGREPSSRFGLLVSFFFFFKGLFYVYENLACTEDIREFGSAGVIDDCEPLCGCWGLS